MLIHAPPLLSGVADGGASGVGVSRASHLPPILPQLQEHTGPPGRSAGTARCTDTATCRSAKDPREACTCAPVNNREEKKKEETKDKKEDKEEEEEEEEDEEEEDEEEEEECGG